MIGPTKKVIMDASKLFIEETLSGFALSREPHGSRQGVSSRLLGHLILIMRQDLGEGLSHANDELSETNEIFTATRRGPRWGASHG